MATVTLSINISMDRSFNISVDVYNYVCFIEAKQTVHESFHLKQIQLLESDILYGNKM